MRYDGNPRIAIKRSAKELLRRFFRPCAVCAGLLVTLTLLGQGFSLFTDGNLYYLYLPINDFPVQTGFWRANATMMTTLMATMDLAHLGDLGGILFALRDDATGLVLVVPVAWRHLMRIVGIQAVVTIISAPLQMGVLMQHFHVLRQSPLPLRQVFQWYLDLRLTVKAILLQLLLRVFRTVTQLLCTIPGLACLWFALRTPDSAFLLGLAPALSALGIVAAAFCYFLLAPAEYVLASSPEMSIWAALAQGLRITTKRRKAYLMLNLSFIPWAIFSAILMNIPSLYVTPYRMLSNYLFLFPPQQGDADMAPIAL